jgi:hypothetical protein
MKMLMIWSKLLIYSIEITKERDSQNGKSFTPKRNWQMGCSGVAPWPVFSPSGGRNEEIDRFCGILTKVPFTPSLSQPGWNEPPAAAQRIDYWITSVWIPNSRSENTDEASYLVALRASPLP